MCVCELSDLEQWISFPSITDRGNIKARMEANKSISTDCIEWALIYLYFVVSNSLSFIKNGFLMHLHSRCYLTGRIKKPEPPVTFFLNENVQKFLISFNKPFNINLNLPSFVLGLWSIQHLIGNYVWLAGFTAARRKARDEGRGQDSDSPGLYFMHTVNSY